MGSNYSRLIAKPDEPNFHRKFENVRQFMEKPITFLTWIQFHPNIVRCVFGLGFISVLQVITINVNKVDKLFDFGPNPEEELHLKALCHYNRQTVDTNPSRHCEILYLDLEA